MKLCALLLLTLCAAATATADDTGPLFTELENARTTDARRDELVAILATEPFSAAGPRLLREMRAHEEEKERLASSENGPGQGNPSLSLTDKISYAAQEIWKRQIERAAPGSLAEALMALAENASSEYERTESLRAIDDRHDTAGIHARLEELAASGTSSPQLSYLAVGILIEKELNRYFPLFLDVCRRFPESIQASRFEHGLSLEGAKFNQENSALFLDYAFHLLHREADEAKTSGYLYSSYFTATFIGRCLHAPNEFSPDEKLPQYHLEKESGLTPAFFRETVENAFDWERTHRDKKG